MAAFDTTRTAYGTSSAVTSFSRFVSNLVATVAAWNDARVTRNALAKLSDRELADIGLSRGALEDLNDGNLIR